MSKNEEDVAIEVKNSMEAAKTITRTIFSMAESLGIDSPAGMITATTIALTSIIDIVCSDNKKLKQALRNHVATTIKGGDGSAIL